MGDSRRFLTTSHTVTRGDNHKTWWNDGLTVTWQYILTAIRYTFASGLGPKSYDCDLQYRRELLNTTMRWFGKRCRCAAISWFSKSVTRVQSVGPYNLTLSRLAVTSHHDSRRRVRAWKERLTWLVSWPTQTTSRTGRSQRMDRQLHQMTASRPCRQK